MDMLSGSQHGFEPILALIRPAMMLVIVFVGPNAGDIELFQPIIAKALKLLEDEIGWFYWSAPT